jgi:hypothetical protein
MNYFSYHRIKKNENNENVSFLLKKMKNDVILKQKIIEFFKGFFFDDILKINDKNLSNLLEFIRKNNLT